MKQFFLALAADMGLNDPVVGREYRTRSAGPFGPVAKVLEVREGFVSYTRTDSGALQHSCTVGQFAWSYEEKT
jgi:hypothetical protein